MRRKTTKTLSGILPFVLLAYLASASAHAQEPHVPKALLSEEEELVWASHVLGPDEAAKSEVNCKKCHPLEYDAWTQTQHYATFRKRQQSDRAKEILEALGVKSMKRSSECRQCHYTPTVPASARNADVAAAAGSKRKSVNLRPKWGVSCESCHSPGLDWQDIHNREGGTPDGKVLKWGEGRARSPGDRAARIAAAQRKGMVHPGMLYTLASNCVGCHTVPRERLVNKGDHKAGSDFELATWSQGEIRHSFLSSPGAPDAATNREATPSHRRMLFVVGAMVDLEYSLRNLQRAKDPGGKYQKAMLERVGRLRERLADVAKAGSIPELQGVLGKIPATLSSNAKVDESWISAVESAARAVADRYDGSTLAALDPLIPTENKGEPYEESN